MWIIESLLLIDRSCTVGFMCLSCYQCHAKDIDTCIENMKEVDCPRTKNGCFYQESENYIKHTSRAVTFGCGRTYSVNGCDVRMGVFKCVKWCKENYCNKNMVRPVVDSAISTIKLPTFVSFLPLVLFTIVQVILL